MRRKSFWAGCLALFIAGTFIFAACGGGTPSLKPPGIPANVTAIGEDSAVLVTWDLFPNNNAGITHFQVSWRIGTGLPTFAEFSASDAAGTENNSFRVEGLIPLTTYQFRVRAENADGWGAFSEWVTATPTEGEFMAPVVTVSPRNASIDVIWTIPSARVIDYTVEWALNSNFSPVLGSETLADNRILITGLDNGVEYFIRVRARNPEEFSPWSDTRSTTPVPWTEAPEAPANITFDIAHTQHGELRLEWTAAARADGYNVKFNTVNNEATATWFPAMNAVIPFSNVTITGLTGGVEYFVWVRAINNVAPSAWIPAGSRLTPNRPAPQAFEIQEPTVLGSLTLTWIRESGVLSNEVMFGTSNDFSAATPWTTNVLANGTVITGLPNAVMIYVWVRAQNSVGWGDWAMRSLATLIQTPVVTLSDNPEELVIQWAAVDNATGYIVRHHDADSFDDAASVNAATNSLILPKAPGEYFVWVRAVTPVGESPWSAMRSHTVRAQITAPQFEFNMEDLPAGTLRLKWEESAGLSYNVRFGLQNDILASAQLAAGSITSTGATISGLVDNTLYHVWVRAFTSAGVSDWVHGSATTITPVMAAPTNIAIDFPAWTASIGQIRVHWTPPDGAVRYEIARSTTATSWHDTAGIVRLTHTPSPQGPGSVNRFYPADNTLFQIVNLQTVTADGAPQEWKLWVVAFDAAGNRSVPVAASTANVPSLGIDARVRQQLTLQVSHVPGALSYELLENTVKDIATATPLTLDGNRRIVRNFAPEHETKRHYWVRAIMPNGPSTWRYAHGSTQSAPLDSDLPIFPEWNANIKAREAMSAKTSIIMGNHPTIDPAVWFAGRGIPIRHTTYALADQADPRVHLNYRIGMPRQEVLNHHANAPVREQLLANVGKPFFDTIILFSVAIRDRDCLNDKPSFDAAAAGNPVASQRFLSHINGRPDNHNCNRTGLHLHIPNALQHILDNRDIYVRPLQEAGMIVIASILGDWSGIDTAMFGEWPFEDVSPLAGPGRPGLTVGTTVGSAPIAKFIRNGQPFYPYHNGARDMFLNDVKNFLNRYQLDGICLDDEWASELPLSEYSTSNATGANHWIYSISNVGSWGYYVAGAGSGWANVEPRTSANANARRGQNAAQFVVALRETLGPDRIIHLYEFGIYNTAQFHRTVVHPFTGEIVTTANFYTYSTQPFWTGTPWRADSAIGTARENFAAQGLNLGGDGATATGVANNFQTLRERTRDTLSGGYGWVTSYGLLDRYRAFGGRRDMPYGQPSALRDNRRNVFGANDRQFEEYISHMTQIMYGAPTIWVGTPQTFGTTQGEWGPWQNRNLQPWVIRELHPGIQ